MQAIITKYLSATNTKHSRIKATSNGCHCSVTKPYDSGLNIDENHRIVAQLLADKCCLFGKMIQGHTDSGCVFVFIPK